MSSYSPYRPVPPPPDPWLSPPPKLWSIPLAPGLVLSPAYTLESAKQQFAGVAGNYIVSLNHSSVLEPIDSGVAKDIGARLGNHDRRWEWEIRSLFEPGSPQIVFQAISTPWWEHQPDAFRLMFEAELRAYFRSQGCKLCGQIP